LKEVERACGNAEEREAPEVINAESRKKLRR